MLHYKSITFIAYGILAIVCACTSCYSPRYVYSPSTQNIPLLTKKGDVNLAGYFATGGGSSGMGFRTPAHYNVGLDLQGSIAAAKHFAIVLNTYNRWEKNNYANDFNFGDSASVQYKRSLTELGGGYFAPLGTISRNAFWQLLGGVAFGKFQIEDNSLKNGIHYNRHHYAHVTKIFIQPAIVISHGQNFTASISSRFSEVLYYNISTSYSKEELDKYLLTDLSSSPVFFWEPAIGYSIAFKKIKGIRVGLQCGFSILMNSRFVDYRTINMGLGVIGSNDLFKSRAAKK